MQRGRIRHPIRLRKAIGALLIVAGLLSWQGGAGAATISWREWGPEAFREAKEQDRLILLNLTARWGQWCKAMDRETFADPAVAAIVSASFVPVKVDRDERPEINDRYKSGGWPTVAVLTVEGEILESVTYVEPGDLVDFLAALDFTYRSGRETVDKVYAQAAAQRDALAEAAMVREPTQELSLQIVRNVAGSIAIRHDDANGGFPSERGAKYPHPEIVDFLLYLYAEEGDEQLREMARKTLDGMAAGAIRDHVNGGFFRYTTDLRWREPRFEKVLEDNAALVGTYVRAYRALGRAAYRTLAEETIAWLDRVLWDEQQGLYRFAQESPASGAEADRFHTWEFTELEQILDPAALEAFALRYGITSAGDVTGPDGISRSGLNVLYELTDVAGVARETGLAPADVEAVLARAMERVREYARGLPQPEVDPRCPVIGNALLVRAYLDAAVVLEREELRRRAIAVLDRLVQVALDLEKGAAHLVEGDRARLYYLALDDVRLAAALLRGYSDTGDRAYLERAQALAALVLRRHATHSGVLCDLAADAPHEGMLRVRVGDRDATALMGQVLLDVGLYGGEAAYRDRAYSTLRGLVDSYVERGHFAAEYAWAVRRCFLPSVRAIVCGPEGDEAADALHAAALLAAVEHPQLRVQRLVLPRDADLAKALGVKASETGAVVCEEKCGAPLASADELRAALAAAASRAKAK